MVKMKKLSSVILLMSMLAWLSTAVVSAHVTVYPKETTQGSYEKFIVRVPSESKEASTVKVEVKFQTDAVSISRVEPKPGWSYELVKNTDGLVTGVIWTADGEGLSPEQFTEFGLSGRTADQASSITWKAYQSYSNGEVVEWVGADGSDKPASVTAVKAKPAGAATDSHGHTSAEQGAVHEPAAEASSASNTPLYLSIAALILGALSLIVSLMKKSK